MNAIQFDTLQYVKKAKEVGFTEAQAELQAEAMNQIINEKLVTKEDLRQFELRIDQRFDQVNQRFEQIDNRFEQIDQRFIEFEERIIDKVTNVW